MSLTAAVPAGGGRSSAGRSGRRIRGVPVEVALEDFSRACLSRALDDRALVLFKQGRAFFQISGAGHEALLLALARHLRPGYDWFFPYYRDQALMLALGVTPDEILLHAVGSAEDPASGGRQMPSHWGYRDKNVVTQSSATGSQCLPAVGCAEAARYLCGRPAIPGCCAHADEVTYVSLGEGATSEGEFWESLNAACLLRLPVLFVVADNGYAISVRATEQSAAPVSQLAAGFPGLGVHVFDGTNYFEAYHRAAAAIARVRSGAGPALVHATVTRPYSHSASDSQGKYRAPEDLDAEAARDPLRVFEAVLLAAGVLTGASVAAIKADAHEVVARATERALAAARPDPGTVRDHVYVLPDLAVPDEPPVGTAPEVGRNPVVTLGEAVNRTLRELMQADERIRVFGEDVADAPPALLARVEGKGGVFGTTQGLQRRFGEDRCCNTPLAEASIVGRAVGQALRGLRPAPEIQFFDYIWPAMQQLRTEAATIRWRSNGVFTCPMVVRVPIGGYLSGGAIWHSQSGESIFAHTPGLLVAFPSRASDAAGLLRYAFRCEDPVLFLEHKHLLRQAYARDPFPPPDYVLPFGRGALRRRGGDLTLVTWGATVQKSLDAAAALERDQGLATDVIDLRTIVPWDQALVADSVRRTGRVLIVHEDTLTCGFGAEVAAWIGDHLFGELDAPVRRVGATDTFVAYEPTLENAILPQVADILAAAQDVLRY